MSPLVVSRTRGRRIWPRLVPLFLLLLSLAVLPAAWAQETSGDEPNPPDAALAVEPVVLSESRAGDAKTVTIEVPIGADTFTASDRPTTNFSTDSFLRVGFNKSGNGAERIFLYFPLDKIPANATIQSAVLRANVAGFSPNNDAPMGLLARFLITSWNPPTITWSNTNPQWGAEIGLGQVPASTGWVEGDVTGPVQDWVSGVRPNFGMMLQGDESPAAGRERVFFALNAQNGLYPRLVVTYQIDTMPPTSIVNPLPVWSRATFNVSWTGQDNQGGSGIKHYDLQARANGGPWQAWLNAATVTAADFNGQDGVLYEFRVRAVDRANNVQAFPNNPQANTRVDATPPIATVTALPQYTYSDAFTVRWGGADIGANGQPGSGIVRYDVEYRVNGGAWQPFKTNTTDTSGQVTQAAPGATYGFRARARDLVGNQQAFSATAQAQTTLSLGNPTARIIPFINGISRQATFLVQWTGTAAPGAAIMNYDVESRFNNGPWTPWHDSFAAASAQFTAIQGDGVYSFRVRARDNAGRVSDWAEGPANRIAVDTAPPFITPRVYVPISPNK